MVGGCFGVLLGLHVGMLVLGDRLDRVLLIRELDPIGPLIINLTFLAIDEIGGDVLELPQKFKEDSPP